MDVRHWPLFAALWGLEERPPFSSGSVVLPPPPSGRSRPVAPSEQSDSADLLALLQSDTSKYALCPGDPGMLAGLMRDVGSAVRRSVRPNTQRKDRSSWRKWVAFCRMLNTPEVRDCVDAHAGLDTSGARRERFLQAAFFLYAFRTMVPRHRAHQTAKNPPVLARASTACAGFTSTWTLPCARRPPLRLSPPTAWHRAGLDEETRARALKMSLCKFWKHI